MFVSVLETLNEAKHFGDISADWQVVDAVLTKDTLCVDDVSGAHGDASIFTILDEALVGAGDALGDIRDHGDAHLSETSSSSRLQGVLTVSEVGVDGTADELDVHGLEFGAFIVELADFSGAHESEIKRPEEKNDVFALELFEGNIFELSVPPSGGLETWGGLAYNGGSVSLNHSVRSVFKNYTFTH